MRSHRRSRGRRAACKGPARGFVEANHAQGEAPQAVACATPTPTPTCRGGGAAGTHTPPAPVPPAHTPQRVPIHRPYIISPMSTCSAGKLQELGRTKSMCGLSSRYYLT